MDGGDIVLGYIFLVQIQVVESYRFIIEVFLINNFQVWTTVKGYKPVHAYLFASGKKYSRWERWSTKTLYVLTPNPPILFWRKVRNALCCCRWRENNFKIAQKSSEIGIASFVIIYFVLVFVGLIWSLFPNFSCRSILRRSRVYFCSLSLGSRDWIGLLSLGS